MEETEDPTDEKYKHLDKYREDWADSVIYKRAMKAEAIKRDLPFEEYECDDDD